MASAHPLNQLQHAGRVVEEKVRPQGNFDGWNGRELTPEELAMTDLDEINAAAQRDTAHLSYDEALAFWRAMHAEAAAQLARLSPEQLAAPGPTTPPNWHKPHLQEVVTALTDHYAAHMST